MFHDVFHFHPSYFSAFSRHNQTFSRLDSFVSKHPPALLYWCFPHGLRKLSSARLSRTPWLESLITTLSLDLQTFSNNLYFIRRRRCGGAVTRMGVIFIGRAILELQYLESILWSFVARARVTFDSLYVIKNTLYWFIFIGRRRGYRTQLARLYVWLPASTRCRRARHAA